MYAGMYVCMYTRMYASRRGWMDGWMYSHCMQDIYNIHSFTYIYIPVCAFNKNCFQ